MQADGGFFTRTLGCPLVVPRRQARGRRGSSDASVCSTTRLDWYRMPPSSRFSSVLASGEQRQRLIGVRGQHDVVEALFSAVAVHDHAGRQAPHGAHGVASRLSTTGASSLST